MSNANDSPGLPALKRLESCSPPPNPGKESFDAVWSELDGKEKSEIIASLSEESMLPDLDPVIIMDYRDISLNALHAHLGTLAIAALPAFLGGALPATPPLLAAAITTAVANNHGTVVSSRVITGLSSFQGMLCGVNAANMVNTTLGPLIAASGAGTLVDLRHVVSHNRLPPNDIGMNTLTL